MSKAQTKARSQELKGELLCRSMIKGGNSVHGGGSNFEEIRDSSGLRLIVRCHADRVGEGRTSDSIDVIKDRKGCRRELWAIVSRHVCGRRSICGVKSKEVV